MWKPHEMQRNVSHHAISREMHKANILDVMFSSKDFTLSLRLK
jgi:hypothetical protein